MPAEKSPVERKPEAGGIVPAFGGSHISTFSIAVLTALALLAFAGNSLLNRAALAGGLIDAGNFTAIRLGSGAIFLSLLLLIRRKPARLDFNRDIRGGLALFLYAACFSYAYLGLSAGVGALILFASVQISMQGIAIFRGQRINRWQVGGMVVAVGGLVYLLAPGAQPPPFGAAMLMLLSGFAWGVYSILGLKGQDATNATARNFIVAALLALPFIWLSPVLPGGGVDIHGRAIIFAILSGVVTSALGYVIWYAILPRLNAMVAAMLQLLVPVIAAYGGILLLGEILTTRLIVATMMIVTGIFLHIWKRG